MILSTQEINEVASKLVEGETNEEVILETPIKEEATKEGVLENLIDGEMAEQRFLEDLNTATESPTETLENPDEEKEDSEKREVAFVATKDPHENIPVTTLEDLATPQAADSQDNKLQNGVKIEDVFNKKEDTKSEEAQVDALNVEALFEDEKEESETIVSDVLKENKEDIILENSLQEEVEVLIPTSEEDEKDSGFIDSLLNWTEEADNIERGESHEVETESKIASIDSAKEVKEVLNLQEDIPIEEKENASCHNP